MNRKDIKSVQNIAELAWHATYDGIIPRDIQDDFLKSAYSESMMKKRMKKSMFFVSEAEGEVVGFAQFTSPEKGKTGLTAIYLYPEYQGKGIGTALLEEGIRGLGRVNEIYLNVERDNHPARRFYEAKGFEVVTEFTEDFGGHVLNTVQMVLKI